MINVKKRLTWALFVFKSPNPFFQNQLNSKVLRLFLLIYAIFLSLPIITAQQVPTFLIDDIELHMEDVGCICSPGVINKSRGKGLLIQYGVTSGGRYTPDQVDAGIAPSNVNRVGLLKVRLKIPLLVKPKTKFLVGVDHFREKYHFDFVQPKFEEELRLINGTTLKASRITGYLIQSLGETNYIGVQARLGFNGNYQPLVDTDDFYSQYRISALWGIKKRDDLEWGLGIFYSNNFNRQRILPFLLYNRTFNERWGIEAAFPVSILMRYNFNPRDLILFGPEFVSYRYAIKNDGPGRDFYFRHSEIQLAAKYEREITPWVWASVHGGFQINFDSEFENAADPSEVFEPDLRTGVFLKFGIFLSPPDR